MISLFRLLGFHLKAVGPLGYLLVTSLVGVLSDLTKQLDVQSEERQTVEAAPQDRENRYRSLLNAISEGVFIMGTAFNII